MIITVDLDIPISFVLDDCRSGLCNAVQTPSLDSFGLGVVDGPWRVECLCVGSDETKIVLVIGIVRMIRMWIGMCATDCEIFEAAVFPSGDLGGHGAEVHGLLNDVAIAGD